MADSFIQIAADSSGKKLDTRTEATNSEHRQVVILGDPSTNAGVAPVDATNGLKVDASGVTLTVASHAVTNAGTFAVQATLAAGATAIAKAEDVASADADVGVPAMAIRKATPANTSGTDGDYEMLQVSAGRLWTDSNIRFAGTTPDLGAGTGGSATLRAVIDSSQFAALQTAPAALSTGAQLVSLPTDQVVANKVQAQTSGVTSSRVDASASSNTATNLKASAGAIREIDVFNVAAYDVFLKIYNKASAPTVGTDTPVWTIPIKAGTGYARSFPNGKWLGTGVSYGITKLQADSDTTALTAHDLTGSIDWI